MKLWSYSKCSSKLVSFAIFLKGWYVSLIIDQIDKFETQRNDRGVVTLTLTTTKLVKSIEAYDILGQLQLHADHSFGALISGFWIGGTERVRNSQAVDRNVIGVGCVQYAVIFQLAEELHTQEAIKRHEEQEEKRYVVDLLTRASKYKSYC